MSETSIQSSQIEHRFLFVQGDTEYRYTSLPYFVSDSNETWTPSPISMSGVTQTNELAKDPLKITVPRDNSLAQTFLGSSPDVITTVTVFRGQIGSTEFYAYWKGRIAGTSISADAVTLDCENIFTSMRRTGLRAKYQKNCRHALYSDGCGLDINDYEESAVATAASGYGVVITGGDSFDDGYFTGGILKIGSEMRYISLHNGNNLTLLQPSRELIQNGGGSVTLYPGCNHTMTHCKDKFTNLNNYGGFPWIPSKNPFNNGITGSIA